MKAQFWHWWQDEPRLVRLDEDNPIHHFHRSEENEEGYEYEGVTFELINGIVEAQFASGGSGCDGPIHFYSELECPLLELNTGPCCMYVDGIRYPNWKEVSRSQRDLFAEAAGY